MLDIKQRALEIGFDLAGVAPLAAWKDLEFSRRWVERGFGGEMRYLANPKRDDPRAVLPSARSVVCVGLIYNAPLPYSTEVAYQPLTPVLSPPGRGEEENAASPSLGGKGEEENEASPSPGGRGWRRTAAPGEGPRAWISRYAWGRDYHGIMRTKLEALRAQIEKSEPGVETRVYVDTGPIVERAFARLSGIGWTGKNTCLINQGKGSWFFLGVILTSLALAPDLPAPDRCGSCTRCLEACPTGALVEPYVMDASRCIAYLNIELKGSIPVEFRAAMGHNVFGCDICQDVCPWNGRPSSGVRGQRPEAGGRTPQEGGGAEASPSMPNRARPATTARPEFQPLGIPVKMENADWKTENRNSKFESRNSAIPTRQSATGSWQPPASGGPASTDHGQAAQRRVSDFEFRVSLFHPPLAALASIREDDFRRLFARSPIKRAQYRGWLRNLCVAIGNSGDARLVPRLEELAAHPDAVVREHAVWGLRRLGGAP